MSLIKDAYELVKEVMTIAKEVKNQAVMELALNLQAVIFDLKEQSENDKLEIKQLKERIQELLQANIIEENIEYNQRGFFTITNENPRIPYCSHCWKTNKKLVPIAQRRSWWEYSCPECKANIVVMNKDGKGLNG